MQAASASVAPAPRRPHEINRPRCDPASLERAAGLPNWQRKRTDASVGSAWPTPRTSAAPTIDDADAAWQLWGSPRAGWDADEALRFKRALGQVPGSLTGARKRIEASPHDAPAMLPALAPRASVGATQAARTGNGATSNRDKKTRAVPETEPRSARRVGDLKSTRAQEARAEEQTKRALSRRSHRRQAEGQRLRAAAEPESTSSAALPPSTAPGWDAPLPLACEAEGGGRVRPRVRPKARAAEFDWKQVDSRRLMEAVAFLTNTPFTGLVGAPQVDTKRHSGVRLGERLSELRQHLDSGLGLNPDDYYDP